MDFSKLSRSELLDFLSRATIRNKKLSVYEQARELFNQLQKTPGAIFPIPVVDLYLSSIYEGPRDVIYSREDILNLSEDEITAFDELFQFNASVSTVEVNRQRILRILKYLNLLEQPEDILFEGEIRENLCELLDLTDLNNLRLALNLTTLPCPITVVEPGEEEEYRDRQIFIPAFVPSSVRSVHFNQVDDLSAELAASIQEEGLDWTLIDQAQKGNYEAVDFLIKTGGDVNYYSGQTPLTAADDPEVVELLLKSGADPNLNGQWSYPLYDASLDKTRLLLAYGADPNHRDERLNKGRTALIKAVINKDTDVIRILLEHKPIEGQQVLNLDIQDEEGNTALYYALKNNDLETTQKLIDHGANPSALVSTVFNDYEQKDPDHEIRDYIIKAGVDINYPVGMFGGTALMDVYKPEAMRDLLAHGADPNIADQRGVTPLMKFVQDRKVDLVRILLEAGADPNHRDEQGLIVLMYVKQSFDNKDTIEIVKLLLNYGADPKVVVENGPDIFSYVLLPEAVKLLLEAGADPNHVDQNGETPLFYAIIAANVETVRLLLEAGADPLVQNRDGATPLSTANDFVDANPGFARSVAIVDLLNDYLYRAQAER